MFKVDEEKTIHLTRGDVAVLGVTADIGGSPYVFTAGEVVRLKVVEEKDCSAIVLQKDVTVAEECTAVEIQLSKEETKIGELINKENDYWYEIELNPDTEPQTIVGYDEDGPKIFRVYPEGDDA